MKYLPVGLFLHSPFAKYLILEERALQYLHEQLLFTSPSYGTWWVDGDLIQQLEVNKTIELAESPQYMYT